VERHFQIGSEPQQVLALHIFTALSFLPPQKFEVGEDERKKPLGSPRHIQDDNIKWMLKELGGRVWTGFI
jgi:hypothetical protein